MSCRTDPFNYLFHFVIYCQADWPAQTPALCWWERSFLLGLAATYVDPALKDLSLADPSSLRLLNKAVRNAQRSPLKLATFPTVLQVFANSQDGADKFVTEAFRWGCEADAARFVQARTPFNPRTALVREWVRTGLVSGTLD